MQKIWTYWSPLLSQDPLGHAHTQTPGKGQARRGMGAGGHAIVRGPAGCLPNDAIECGLACVFPDIGRAANETCLKRFSGRDGGGDATSVVGRCDTDSLECLVVRPAHNRRGGRAYEGCESERQHALADKRQEIIGTNQNVQ